MEAPDPADPADLDEWFPDPPEPTGMWQAVPDPRESEEATPIEVDCSAGAGADPPPRRPTDPELAAPVESEPDPRLEPTAPAPSGAQRPLPPRPKIAIGDPGRAGDVVPRSAPLTPGRNDTVAVWGHLGPLEVRAASSRGLSHRFYGTTRQDDLCLASPDISVVKSDPA